MTKKKKKTTSQDPLSGYVSITQPQSPIIRESQFGIPTSITNPTNVPLITQLVPPSYTPIIKSMDATSGASVTMYTVTPGKTFMLTSLMLCLTYLSGVVSSTSYAKIKAGSDTICQLAMPQTTKIDPIQISMSFPIPVALASGTVIGCESDVNSAYRQAVIVGYEI